MGQGGYRVSDLLHLKRLVQSFFGVTAIFLICVEMGSRVSLHSFYLLVLDLDTSKPAEPDESENQGPELGYEIGRDGPYHLQTKSLPIRLAIKSGEDHLIDAAKSHFIDQWFHYVLLSSQRKEKEA